MALDERYTLGAFAVVCGDLDRVLVSHRRAVDLWNLPSGRVNHESGMPYSANPNRSSGYWLNHPVDRG
jgi:hypothetical protein